MDKFNKNSFLIIGLSLIILGIIVLVGSVNLYISVANIVLIVMILITMKDLFGFLIKKPKLDFKLFLKIINVILAFFAFIFNEYAIAIVPIIFSIYAIGNALIYFINFIIIKINKSKGWFRDFFNGILYFTVGITVLLRPIFHLKDFLTMLGIYCILIGITFIFDYLEVKHSKRFMKFRISLPSIIDVFIPLSVLTRINKTINRDKKSSYTLNKKQEETDLQIIIHVTESGYGRLGHMDICYKGEILSFGNYDKDTRKFHELFGSGVIFKTKNKKEYIKFSIEDQKKTLFVFGIKLSAREDKKIRDNIDKLMNELKPWDDAIFVKDKKQNDYSARLYKATKADFYKFKKTKYKIYFILGNNCVTLANRIVNSALSDSFKFYGILTPGTYYDYLQREYMKKNSKVVSKEIYSKNNIDKI